MRVVSLCPSLTELVALLGRAEALVGRTRFCIHPAELAAVEVVGGTKDPDTARIIELAPDVVLLNEEENRREDHAALVAAGVDCRTSLPRTPREAAQVVRRVGLALDATATAERLACRIETLCSEFERRAAALPPVRFAYLIWRKPWMAAGPGTYVDALFRAVGGVNVVSGAGYPALELASLHEAERVLLSSEPYRFRAVHRGEVAAAAGLAPERVVLTDGEACSWHGSRTELGLAEAWRVLRSASR
ncbi:MAG: helical backbone metal receptor [Planctomycetota bacterium]